MCVCYNSIVLLFNHIFHFQKWDGASLWIYMCVSVFSVEIAVEYELLNDAVDFINNNINACLFVGAFNRIFEWYACRRLFLLYRYHLAVQIKDSHSAVIVPCHFPKLFSHSLMLKLLIENMQKKRDTKYIGASLRSWKPAFEGFFFCLWFWLWFFVFYALFRYSINLLPLWYYFFSFALFVFFFSISLCCCHVQCTFTLFFIHSFNEQNFRLWYDMYALHTMCVCVDEIDLWWIVRKWNVIFLLLSLFFCSVWSYIAINQPWCPIHFAILEEILATDQQSTAATTTNRCNQAESGAEQTEYRCMCAGFRSKMYVHTLSVKLHNISLSMDIFDMLSLIRSVSRVCFLGVCCVFFFAKFGEISTWSNVPKLLIHEDCDANLHYSRPLVL